MSSARPSGTPAASDAAAQRATSGDTTGSATQDTTSLDQGQPAAAQSDLDPSSAANVNNPEAKRASEEAARYRKELREAQKHTADLEARLKELDDAKLSELDKANKRASDAEARLNDRTRAYQERLVRAEIRAAAGGLAFHDPEDAVRLLDWSEFEYDEDGTPTNVGALLDTLAKSKPHLVKASGAPTPAASEKPRPPSAGAPASPARSATNGGGALTREMLENMSPREYAQRRAEVQEWLRTHPNG